MAARVKRAVVHVAVKRRVMALLDVVPYFCTAPGALSHSWLTMGGGVHIRQLGRHFERRGDEGARVE
jgi:hypothetical protein